MCGKDVTEETGTTSNEIEMHIGVGGERDGEYPERNCGGKKKEGENRGKLKKKVYMQSL